MRLEEVRQVCIVGQRFAGTSWLDSQQRAHSSSHTPPRTPAGVQLSAGLAHRLPLPFPLPWTKKKPELCTFLRWMRGTSRALIFSVGAFLIYQPFLTPNSDVLSSGLQTSWAHFGLVTRGGAAERGEAWRVRGQERGAQGAHLRGRSLHVGDLEVTVELCGQPPTCCHSAPHMLSLSI